MNVNNQLIMPLHRMHSLCNADTGIAVNNITECIMCNINKVNIQL
jgi:hypothetical protein